MAYEDKKLDFDVVIIGAESRDEIGVTWSFFNYPGLRSDSDLLTFGFPWKPWGEPEAIVKGPAIVRYMQTTIADAGIDKNIFFSQKVERMSWSSSGKTQEYCLVGSGATAITLLLAMAEDAKHITMLQRSPSYILSVPVQNRLEGVIRTVFPQTLASKLVRFKWVIFPALFRRMCMCPDGDFYECLRGDKASIKTDIIETVTQDSLRLKSCETLHPDIIAAANIRVDGRSFHINEHYVWKGLMFEDLLNLTFSFGYFDASWTLGVGTSARLACRLLRELQRNNVDAIIPRRKDEDRRSTKDIHFLPLSSTYVQKALSALPKLGNRPQWRGRATYMWEILTLRFCDIWTDLEWVKRGEVA
ncbi:FAD/NAD(P)-binding domain-containing protein [Polychaeton citri CBS 116435]|uniref:FAD/NAD(P)-binding domain-containing protein n=1 Tax=Polychaeton citri CBS 116435 TaxID=1314669 RepID=A0A9P4QA48_9PEZI|nr:FAD/NAD(P)-binding domain-containing protein [Polychaeton citri CBS 116435]